MEKNVPTSLEELSGPAQRIIAEINARLAKTNPNIGKTQSVILKNGPQAYKVAIIYEILNSSNKEHHHTVLSIQTWKYKKKENSFEEKDNFNISLNNKDGDEIGILRDFIVSFESEITKEPSVYALLQKKYFEELEKGRSTSKSVKDNINEILEEENSLQELLSQGGTSLFKSLSDWIIKTEEPKAVIKALQTIDSDALKNLNILAGVAQLRKALMLWENNKENGNEGFWQKALPEFSWVISQVFSYPVFLIRGAGFVGGKTIYNDSGNIVDFLYRNKMTDNIVLIEIKTPLTKLLASKYRQTYPMSNELSGAINQILNYRKNIQHDYYSLLRNTKEEFLTISPKCLVIAGDTTQELHEIEQKEAFEFSRLNSKDVEIISFNELFLKVEMLISLFEEKHVDKK